MVKLSQCACNINILTLSRSRYHPPEIIQETTESAKSSSDTLREHWDLPNHLNSTEMKDLRLFPHNVSFHQCVCLSNDSYRCNLTMHLPIIPMTDEKQTQLTTLSS